MATAAITAHRLGTRCTRLAGCEKNMRRDVMCGALIVVVIVDVDVELGVEVDADTDQMTCNSKSKSSCTCKWTCKSQSNESKSKMYPCSDDTLPVDFGSINVSFNTTSVVVAIVEVCTLENTGVAGGKLEPHLPCSVHHFVFALSCNDDALHFVFLQQQCVCTS